MTCDYVFLCAPNLCVMEEFWTRAVELPVSCPGQEWRGLRENCVSFCTKHQEADRNGPCITGGSCRLWKAMHQHRIYLRLAFPRLTRNNKEMFIIRKTIVLLRRFSGIPSNAVFFLGVFCLHLRFIHERMESVSQSHNRDVSMWPFVDSSVIQENWAQLSL